MFATDEDMLSDFYSNYESIHFWSLNKKEDTKINSDYYDGIYLPYIPIDKNVRIIDCGCGNGMFLYFLQRHGFVNAYGIEYSKELIEFQTSELGVSAVQGDAITHLRKAQAGFELIVANDFLEHLHKNRVLEFIYLCVEKLSPTGRLFVKVPNMASLFASRNRYVCFTHEVGFTEHSLASVLKTCGFRYVTLISDFRNDHEPESAQRMRDLYVTLGETQPKILSTNIVAICAQQEIVPTNTINHTVDDTSNSLNIKNQNYRDATSYEIQRITLLQKLSQTEEKLTQTQAELSHAQRVLNHPVIRAQRAMWKRIKFWT